MGNKILASSGSGRKLLVLGLISLSFVGLFAWGWKAHREAATLAAAGTGAINIVREAAASQVVSDMLRNQAEEERSVALAGQLAKQARLLYVSEDMQRVPAVLLAVQSMRISPLGEAALTLQENTLAYPVSSIKSPGGVSSVAISPDGGYVLAVGTDHRVRAWKLSSREQVAEVAYAEGANAAAFSPDGRYIVSGGCDRKDPGTYACQEGSARVWSILAGREIARVTQADRVLFVAFSPDGKYVASAGCDRAYDPNGSCSDHALHIWRAYTGEEIRRIEHTDFIKLLSFSPDGRTMASGSCEERQQYGSCLVSAVRVWDLKNGRQVSHIEYAKDIWSVAFSPDGAYLLTGADTEAGISEVLTGKLVKRLASRGTVRAVAFSPDGQHAATANYNEGLSRIWDLSKGMETAHSPGWTRYISFSSDGQYILSGIDNFSTRVWDARTGQEIARISHTSWLSSAAFSPDGKYVVSGDENGIIRISRITGEEPYRQFLGFGGASLAVLSPDGNYLAATISNLRVVVWDLASGNAVAEFPGYELLGGRSFSPDSQSIAVKSSAGSVVVFSIHTQSGPELQNSRAGVGFLAFSPDGKAIAGAGPQNICFWELESGTQTSCPPLGKIAYSIDFSPDGKYLAVGGSDGVAQILEVSSGKEISRFIQDRGVGFVAFSPDGRYGFSIGESKGYVWEAATGREVSRLLSQDSMSALGFSGDGSYLLTRTSQFASIWQVSNGRELSRVPALETTVLGFSQDGNTILTISSSGIVHEWPWRAEDLVNDACSRLDRNLTRFDWQRYIGDALPYQAICPQYPVEGEPLPMFTPSPIPSNTPSPAVPLVP